MQPAQATAAEFTEQPTPNRWLQLALGVVCMIAIASPQYVWALFTKPFMAKLDVTLAQVQVVFSILVALQCFLAPVNGYLVEKFGARRLLAVGAVLTGASWVSAAQAQSPHEKAREEAREAAAQEVAGSAPKRIDMSLSTTCGETGACGGAALGGLASHSPIRLARPSTALRE